MICHGILEKFQRQNTEVSDHYVASRSIPLNLNQIFVDLVEVYILFNNRKLYHLIQNCKNILQHNCELRGHLYCYGLNEF